MTRIITLAIAVVTLLTFTAVAHGERADSPQAPRGQEAQAPRA